MRSAVTTPGAARRESQRGFALATTLGFTVILALAALAISAAARFNGAVIRNSVDLLRARNLLRNASEIALADLSAIRPQAAFPIDGQPVSFELDDGRAVVAIVDERGKLDLNAAAPAQLDALFALVAREAGVVPPPIATIVRAREERPYEDVSELESRPGLAPAFVGRLRAFLTTSTRAPTINPLVAPKQVLRSIDGVTPALIAQIEAARSRGTPPPNLGDAQRYVTLDVGPFYSVRTVVKLDTGPTLSEDMLVKAEQRSDQQRMVSVLRRY